MASGKRSHAQQPRKKGAEYGRHPGDLYGPVFEAIDQARAGDPAGAAVLVHFLESDAYSLGSGYLRGAAVRAVTRLDLDVRARRRLRDVLFARVDASFHREFRSYARLARWLDSPALRGELAARAEGTDRQSARQARWLLEAMGREPLTGK